ncbi:MAG: choice-of-anchor V domain-containing protein [Bryobacteraceae bacterium]
MERRKKIIAAKCAAVMAVIPVLMYAYEYGPDAHYTAVPGTGESTCASNTTCHLTSTPVNKGGGSVSVAFPNGMTYTPGQVQTLTITIADPIAKVYGFEMTARLGSNLAGGQAGTFTPDSHQGVLCAAPAISDIGVPRTSAACPAGKPLEFIEHNNVPYTTGVITVQWTPPATNVGNVGIYISANAANTPFGLYPTDIGHIYNTGYTLTPATSGGGGTPSISQNGVVSAGAFGGFTSVAPGSWIEIYGTNLAPDTRSWAGSDFNGNNAPTSLDGVSVSIGGQAAYVDFISSGQVNAQAPSNVGTGPQQLTVTTPAGTSDPYNITVNVTEPGMLAPPQFKVNNKQYAAALLPDGTTFLVPAGAIAGVASRPAKPGETIIIYGVGFGAVTPDIPAGQIVQPAPPNSLAQPIQIMFGTTPATLSYKGLAPGYVGLYQFNVVVPAVPDNNLVPLTFNLGGVAGTQTLFTAVHR